MSNDLALMIFLMSFGSFNCYQYEDTMRRLRNPSKDDNKKWLKCKLEQIFICIRVRPNSYNFNPK